MKKLFLIVAIVLTVASLVLAWNYFNKTNLAVPADSILAPIIKPLEKYTIENLSQVHFTPRKIEIGDEIKNEPEFTSRYFFFDVDPHINSTNIKKVGGLINIPKKPGVYPVIIMLRGFVPKEIYQTGIGTQRAAEELAKNGFITLAPDFLGYGKSDPASENSIEDRLQTYVSAATLLNSIANLNQSLSANNLSATSNPTKIGIWGHSNGGQIALTTLEITGKSYPTVLWAPVSKPFPFSILYYTDDFDDHGRALRKVVAEFEKDYDVELYSLPNYLDKIQAPIQLHQGTADDAVPVKWSDTLVESLKKLEKDITYFTYPGADHNLLGGWKLAVNRSIAFYKEHLK